MTASRGSSKLILHASKSSTSKGFSVYQRDLDTLNPGTWLNDTIVDFCLQRPESTESPFDLTLKATRWEIDDVHIFTSLFFVALSKERGYSKLCHWSKNLDLFSKKFVFIPIVKNSHWTLAVIKDPSLFLRVLRSDTPKWRADASPPPARTAISGASWLRRWVSRPITTLQPAPLIDLARLIQGTANPKTTVDTPAYRDFNPEHPTIIYFHSMSVKRSVLESLVGGYFQFEAVHRKQDILAQNVLEYNINDDSERNRVAESLPPCNVLTALAPKQENEFDCAVYMLHSTERFLSDPEGSFDIILNRHLRSESLTPSVKWNADEAKVLRDE
ncbi:hypothetical protein CF319_g7914 [Tilletia indica]|nr:hypothetical protein CF319_g7914 [Tilletia indica]